MENITELAADYYTAWCENEPIYASVQGTPGYDAEVPDPTREGSAAWDARLAGFAARVEAIDPETLHGEDRVTRDMLARTIRDDREAIAGGLGEIAVSATTSGVLAEMVAVVPMTNVGDPALAEAYLTRLGKLGGYFDGLTGRYLQAVAEGRTPTERGVRQTIAQIDGYLANPVATDPMLRPRPEGVDTEAWRARGADIVAGSFRPALARYRAALAERILPTARGQEHVGVTHVPGGAEAYRDAVRRHTTTEMTPEELHETGLALVAGLREEFAERGGRALGATGTAQVLTTLRTDPALRYTSAEEIVDTVTIALRRAEEALPDAFKSYDIAPCVVRPMDATEAADSVLGYYLAPSGDGSRPGAHVVNTYRPDLRTRFEYECLAFHESVPGHHLQLALGVALTGLPDFRRYAYVTAHSEGWGLYTERLTDELGLYTDELAKLGMVSFDAWRACRLVVDTGMHYYGWSREKAIQYMLDNTALSEANIVNEVDRYIAWPGQALAYMVGRLRIQAARDRAKKTMGDRFDLKGFHDQVLGHGSIPLDTMDGAIDRWAAATS
ncbi:hypothetical protein Afil01_35140 [Actinorhabdospora filicis]|uniref:DUF885 domain-containing protein n=1 Tax=Actinorhabdospora filicis TaxID=1785913 RepID=A0A9W6SMW6_9ACTN|nr:DUF885 domain-containing protein [Actinorhabdospora filicis]GLZ78707.1 hypothetical protein Afil01_35140 [Actinorhabdospora filicis]